MQLTLRALFDEYKKYRNWWTVSNQGLPLVKYLGCQFKFYRSAQTDYIVIPILTPPYAVTEEIYLNTQPSRALMNRRKIVVPRLDRPWTKKPYIKRKFKAPALFMNKWYFQVDIYNIPLIVLHTTTCSFDQMYQPMDQLSYNLTLTSLNTDFFQNPQFADLDDNGYIPKVTGTIPTVLYTTTNGSMDKPTHYKQLVPLKSTERYTDGHMNQKHIRRMDKT